MLSRKEVDELLDYLTKLAAGSCGPASAQVAEEALPAVKQLNEAMGLLKLIRDREQEQWGDEAVKGGDWPEIFESVAAWERADGHD